MAAQTIIEKMKLSASTDGRMVKVAATATPGTLLHTANSSTTDDYDEIWLWAVNSDTTARKLTIEFGGTTSPDDTIEVTIAPEAGLQLIVPGLILRNGLNVRAFAAAGNVILIAGYVNVLSN